MAPESTMMHGRLGVDSVATVWTFIDTLKPLG